jgi:hypothetical protein
MGRWHCSHLGRSGVARYLDSTDRAVRGQGDESVAESRKRFPFLLFVRSYEPKSGVLKDDFKLPAVERLP